jgi:hypothetical protein
MAGGSLTERARLTISGNTLGTTTSGYIVWYPSYHNYPTGDDTPMNAYYFENANSAIVPTNTVANPLGQGTTNTTGTSVFDPFGTTLAGNAFSRAKTISACLQVEYIGALSSISGQVALIPNFSLRAFNSSLTSPVITATTVDTLFGYASVRERLQVSGHEVIWRPTVEEAVLRTGGSEYNAFNTYTGPRPNTIILKGTGGVDQTTITAETSDSLGICIAWRGVPNLANCLSINLVKTVALELAPIMGIQTPYVEPLNTSSPFATVTTWLDRNAPNWQTRFMNTSWNVAGSLARAFAPRMSSNLIGNGTARRGNLRIENMD